MYSWGAGWPDWSRSVLYKSINSKSETEDVYSHYSHEKPARFVSQQTGAKVVVVPHSVGGTEEAKDYFSLIDIIEESIPYKNAKLDLIAPFVSVNIILAKWFRQIAFILPGLKTKAENWCWWSMLTMPQTTLMLNSMTMKVYFQQWIVLKIYQKIRHSSKYLRQRTYNL